MRSIHCTLSLSSLFPILPVPLPTLSLWLLPDFKLGRHTHAQGSYIVSFSHPSTNKVRFCLAYGIWGVKHVQGEVAIYSISCPSLKHRLGLLTPFIFWYYLSETPHDQSLRITSPGPLLSPNSFFWIKISKLSRHHVLNLTCLAHLEQSSLLIQIHSISVACVSCQEYSSQSWMALESSGEIVIRFLLPTHGTWQRWH